MRFLIPVWNQCSSDLEFEEAIPLGFNGRRLAELGERNRAEVLVLEGYERFSESYLGGLRELGYVLHDCGKLAQELASRIPVFVHHYRNWGGIKHFCMLRSMVMSRVFPGEDVIMFDGDMIFNAGFDEIADAIGGRLYFLGESTCLGSIPARSDYCEIFESHALRANDDPEGYARDVMHLDSAGQLLEPNRFGGTDAAFLRHLRRNGFIDCAQEPLLPGNLIGVENWLKIHLLGLGPYRYERKNGIEYLNGRKLLTSHIKHDFWTYLWQPMVLAKLFGRENLSAFGRIPHIYPHIAQGAPNRQLQGFLAGLHEAFRQNAAAIPGGLNHFSRGAVLRHYYLASDLGEVLNDQLWHTPGVFL